MVNAATARRFRRGKSNKKSAQPEARSMDSADAFDSDVGGGVSLLSNSPTLNNSSTNTEVDEPSHPVVSKELKVEDAPTSVNGEENTDGVEQVVKLDPTSSPFKPVQASTNGQVNGVVHPAPQENSSYPAAQAQQPVSYGGGQPQPFVLPPSVQDMLQANDQNVRQGQQTRCYPIGTHISNGIQMNGNHPAGSSSFAQLPQLPQQPQQAANGQTYGMNASVPAGFVQPMQQMPLNAQQFPRAYGNQQQNLYAQIQAQKQAYEQDNGYQQPSGGTPYQQVAQAAPGMMPYVPTYPQAQLQNGILGMNGQSHGISAPIGHLNPSASCNIIASSPMSPSSEASQETVVTEPRNFAPRSTEPVTSGPPPQFAVPATPLPLPYQTPVPAPAQSNLAYNGPVQNGPSDPFTVAPIPGGIQPLHPTAVQPNNALTIYSNPVPDHIKSARSAQLNYITSGPSGRPSLEVVLDPKNFPFIEASRLTSAAANHGVVKLKNIPFATKRAEILAFLGRNSRVLNDNQEPVHIIMERVTSKTNDAYVEFMNMQAAINAVEKHQKTVSSGRLSRLGDRPIEVELSSQAALMQDLFPLAHGIKWHGASPEFLPDHPTEPWNRFKGFISDEEMTMLVKHVEVPQRSPFSRDCPQRPFECMISTIKKLPWFMPNFVTMRQRYAVFKAALDLIRLLSQAVNDKKNEEYLSPQLLRRLYTAAMLCPGFTVSQKDDISYMLNFSEQQEREFNQPRFANCWTHNYSIAPKPGIPLDVLEWYIAVIREETVRAVNSYPLNVRSQLQELRDNTGDYWGYFWHELNLPSGQDFDLMTLGGVSTFEFQAIDRILRRAFSQ